MIGIDIADLRDPLLHFRGLRAFQMIKHPLEPTPTQFPEQTFWKYWTAKEALYKALKTKLSFQPQTIRIVFNQHNSGFVGYCESINNRSYSGTIVCRNEYVLALAHDATTKPPFFQVVSIITSDESKEIRQKAIAHFSQEFDENVQFGTLANQLPLLRSTTKNRQYEVSLSHHGRFGAFAYSL